MGVMLSRQNRSIVGFTLVEMAIVTIISGMIMIAVARYAAQYMEQQRRTESIENVNYASSTISVYAGTYYPCPSNRALPVDDPKFGVADCAQFATLLPNTCSADGGICRYTPLDTSPSNTFVDAPFIDKNGDGNPDTILVGGFPIKFSGSTDLSKAFDGYGGQINYAVSDNMTHDTGTTTPNDRWGVITVVDEYGQNTGGNSGNAIFVTWSGGKDGRGSFSNQGKLMRACSTTMKDVSKKDPSGGPDIPVQTYAERDLTAGIDNENCDHDGVFVSALGDYDSNGASHYDDFIGFNTRASTLLWEYTKTAAGSVTPNVRNLNEQNVGVKNQTPVYKLDVGGTLHAQTNIRGSFLCNYDGTGCGSLLKITGNDTTAGSVSNRNIRCPSGKVMSGIANWEEQGCSNVDIAVTPSQDCKLGEFVTGFKSDGTIDCH